MNATYIALGALFIVLGMGAMARAKSSGADGADGAATDAAASAKGERLSGILFLVAGLIFMITGAISGRGD